ncbi:MAG: AraC family transcriptional regulator [Planctomycetes bacterium]|nr:AraC family transcriptional regulator [Planctomycetota bacterium]
MKSMPPEECQELFFGKNPGLRSVLQLMSSVRDASFFVKDAKCRYVMCNAVHLAIYGLQHERDLVGKVAGHYFPDLLATAYEAEDRRVLTSGQPIRNEIWLVPRIHSIPRWFVASKSPLFDPRGKVMGLAGLLQPIAAPEHQQTHFQELQRVVEFLEESFVDEVTVKRLAEIAGLSVTHFNRRFRQLLRLSPMQYVESLRIHESQRLLVTTDQSVGQIAVAAGFYDQSHFTKRFRKTTGMTPLAYRKRFGKNQATDEVRG